MHALNADERRRASIGNTARNMYRHRNSIFSLINIATIVNASMCVSLPLFFGALAPLATIGEVGQLADAPRSDVEASHPQHELSFPSDNFSSKRATLKPTRGTVAMAFLLAVAAGVALVVLQCFRAMTSGRIKKNQGATARRVAEGEGESCSVSHHVERIAHTAASPVLLVPAVVSARCRLNLRCIRHVPHYLLDISEQTICLFTRAGRLYRRRCIAAQQRRTPKTFTSRVHA